MRYHYTYITLKPQPIDRGRKTRRYDIEARDGTVIGEVSWYHYWRQYCLHPGPNTVWSAGCLADVAHFIGQLRRGGR